MVPGEPERLPIENIRKEFLAALRAGPVVVSAPTGSGKSTQIPRWCGEQGKVLVIEPRRVACRGLADHVARLEKSALGEAVGYAVRDDVRSSAKTRILFATPGVVLRWLAGGMPADYRTVIIDEFHERSLDVDLLLALLHASGAGNLVVMSATMEGLRVARHLGGRFVEGQGRTYPVTVRHLPGRAFLPDIRGVEERVVAAVDAARDDEGDMLVFLPGKGEIRAASERLRSRRDLEVLTIHGGLSLKEQARIFQSGGARRVILATNVAETSITVPGVGVVIDSGLVRRTRYHGGRGFLTLMPIAMDSAQQRAGRAGRLAPGVCYRLWKQDAILNETTPPEVHRESLVTLVLGAAACRSTIEELPFLDPPRDFAVEAAMAALGSLRALDTGGRISSRGDRFFRLPLDPPLGALLVQAEAMNCLPDAIDLVSALAVGRPLFASGSRPAEEKDDLRAGGCDATAAIRAVRQGEAKRHGLNAFALQEARAVRKRLLRIWKAARVKDDAIPDRRELALAALRADPSTGYVARRRKRRVAWSNGGTEVELARESAVSQEKHDLLVVFETRATGLTARKTSIIITCAMPAPPQWFLAAGLGEDEVRGATVDRGAALAKVARVLAGHVLKTREEEPTGPLARSTVLLLFLEGRAFSKRAGMPPWSVWTQPDCMCASGQRGWFPRT